MRTIGFYSYKGGVGRTNLLLNTAYYLSAHKGKTIGILGMDLEAPGLSVLPCLKPPLGVSGGTGEYPNIGLWHFLDAATKALNGETVKKEPVPKINEILYETAMAHDSQGAVFLAPAYAHWYSNEARMNTLNNGRGADILNLLKTRWDQGIIGRDVSNEQTSVKRGPQIGFSFCGHEDRPDRVGGRGRRFIVR